MPRIGVWGNDVSGDKVSMATRFGWDLGGVNLKLARVEDGQVGSVAQIPCPALAEPRKFDLAAVEALALIGDSDAGHAVTMTGELSDVFASRYEGVAYLVSLMRKLVGDGARFYSLDGFVDAHGTVTGWQDVASANWHASAALAAAVEDSGLLVDVGTTTTDLIPFKQGHPCAVGRTDGDRLTEGELIYRGVVRTPVMAVAGRAPFKGRMQGLAAERFATMADVYRLTGQLPEDADPFPSADNRGKDLEESAARLARMLGRDAEDADIVAWRALAYFLARRLLDQIEADARALIERDGLSPDAPIVGAGCGRFLAAALADRLGCPYRDFADLTPCADEAREMVARCAPAAAVAQLA
jgi:(4-(4-[2-(gamma-L-glutamylamino)ethyl]phenoxymethyl)furan-2-yl)methanamine synthase